MTNSKIAEVVTDLQNALSKALNGEVIREYEHLQVRAEEVVKNCSIPDVVLSLPDDEAIEQWWAEGKESDKFWQEAPYRTNGDVVEEIKTALKYFITVWQWSTTVRVRLVLRVTLNLWVFIARIKTTEIMESEEIIYYCEQGDPYCQSPKCRCNTVRPEKVKEQPKQGQSLPIDNVSVRSSKVAYCRTYVDENGLCKRCGLDNYTHQKMIKDCEAYNAR